MSDFRVKVKKNTAEATIKTLQEKGYEVTREKNVLLVNAPSDDLFWEFFNLKL